MQKIGSVLVLTLWAGLAQASDVTVSKPPAGDAPAVAAPITEHTLVGEYQQPEWTTHRRFPTTRVYLQQPPW
jgi:hypothetical protein